jgi:hypothetical protein
VNTDNLKDIELLLRSRVPIVLVETHEETRVTALFNQLAVKLRMPLYSWTVTTGLNRLDFNFASPEQKDLDADALLSRIKGNAEASLYLLLDFHPYLTDPKTVRLLKEIALRHDITSHSVVLISHQLDVPAELRPLTARFQLKMPGSSELEAIIREEAQKWSRENGGRNVQTQRHLLEALVNNLRGLTADDARRLTRGIIQNGAIDEADLADVMQAKFKLLDRNGALSFEYDTARFADVGGVANLKRWLERRRDVFAGKVKDLDMPKGILLVGVQGGGKSLAAKAVAGLWSAPLLRLDMGSLYNKYFGESERNLREALQTAEIMAPCVLWIDEIEKALSQDTEEGGPSRRMLGYLITWMAEKAGPVFIVATANNIDNLPPELIRKGRLDEIFFVDLPDETTRRDIFGIHLRKRGHDATQFDLNALANATHGFTGAEIEQAIASSLYLAREQDTPLCTEHIHTEINMTRPLSVVMAEPLEALRQWAKERCVIA